MIATDLQTARRRAIGAYALADAERLQVLYAPIEREASRPEPVRGPEIGLVMLRGRAGGGGAAFNLGEASATRATVRVSTGSVGHAMILGRDTAKARTAAHLDALWQDEAWHDRIERDVVEPLLAADEEARGQLAEETAATRVDFFTLVRGEDR